MQDQIKNLPKKYFQITDENKRDRMVAYVRLDEVLEIVNRHTDYPLPEDFKYAQSLDIINKDGFTYKNSFPETGKPFKKHGKQ